MMMHDDSFGWYCKRSGFTGDGIHEACTKVQPYRAVESPRDFGPIQSVVGARLVRARKALQIRTSGAPEVRPYTNHSVSGGTSGNAIRLHRPR
jgi:hypothetical protein